MECYCSARLLLTPKQERTLVITGITDISRTHTLTPDDLLPGAAGTCAHRCRSIRARNTTSHGTGPTMARTPAALRSGRSWSGVTTSVRLSVERTAIGSCGAATTATPFERVQGPWRVRSRSGRPTPAFRSGMVVVGGWLGTAEDPPFRRCCAASLGKRRCLGSTLGLTLR